jgi:hypothetical protein
MGDEMAGQVTKWRHLRVIHLDWVRLRRGTHLTPNQFLFRALREIAEPTPVWHSICNYSDRANGPLSAVQSKSSIQNKKDALNDVYTYT